MPDLATILGETLLGTAAAGASSAMTPMPGSLPPAVPSSASDVADKPIWHYSQPPGSFDRLSSLTCCVGSMGYMPMPVCDAIGWGPVSVQHRGIRYPLPLTASYLMQTNFLPSGYIPPGTSRLWPLEAKTDRSFEHVFGYEIPLVGMSAINPIPEVVRLSPQFMGDGCDGTEPITAVAGQVCTIAVLPLRIVVVVSFVCCKERNDFEPGGVLGAGRLYPIVMVMANQQLDSMSAEVNLSRPATTPHTEMDGETMLPPIQGSLFADRNDSGLPGFWDFFFSHYLVDPPVGPYVMVNPTLPARHISGAVRACGAHYYQVPFLPGAVPVEVRLPPSDSPFDKVARQGEFDNLHIAPRMVAPAHVVAAYPGDSRFTSIAMAPFCVHDCLHTHWRWSSGYGKPHNRGWNAFGPYAADGAPMVPLNQKVTLTMTSPSAFRYLAEVDTPIPAGRWQVVFHHGSAYALTVNALGEAAKALQFGQLTLSNESPISGSGNGWAMFYWRMRYRYDMAGIQERITVTNLALARS